MRRPALAAVAPAALVLVLLALVGLSSLPAAAQGQARRPTETVAKRSTGRRAATPRCRVTQISASLTLTSGGGSTTSLAGALLFHDVSTTACTLAGVPQVRVVTAAGQALVVHEFRSVPKKVVPTVLTAGTAPSGGTTAGSSVTWSDWECGTGSFSLVVTFPGWSSAVTVPYGSTAGYSGSLCTTTGEQTIYVGPVAAVRS